MNKLFLGKNQYILSLSCMGNFVIIEHSQKIKRIVIDCPFCYKLHKTGRG